jgi:hypothetical protein
MCFSQGKTDSLTRPGRGRCRSWATGLSGRPDTAAGGLGRRQTEVGVTLAPGPRLDISASELLFHLAPVRDAPGLSGDEHAPAFVHRFVHSVDLEADLPAIGCRDRRARGGPEHNVAVNDREVDRKRDRSAGLDRNKAPDPSGLQQAGTLLAAQGFQDRVRRRLAAAGGRSRPPPSKSAAVVSSAAARRRTVPAVGSAGLFSRCSM